MVDLFIICTTSVFLGTIVPCCVQCHMYHVYHVYHYLQNHKYHMYQYHMYQYHMYQYHIYHMYQCTKGTVTIYRRPSFLTQARLAASHFLLLAQCHCHNLHVFVYVFVFVYLYLYLGVYLYLCFSFHIMNDDRSMALVGI